METAECSSDKVQMAEVRRRLKEAGSYEATMSDSEMLDIYRALNDSQSTAFEENQRRTILEQTEKNLSMLEELRQNSVPVVHNEADLLKSDSDDSLLETTESTRVKKSMKFTDTQKTTKETKSHEKNLLAKIHPNQNEFKFDVLDSIPTKHRPLKRIQYKPLYGPPYYCNPKIADVKHEQKAQIIAAYHIKLLRSYQNFQRQSIYPAPWDKPIQSNVRFNGNLLRKVEKFEDTNNDTAEENQTVNDDKNSDEDFEIYTSQSGRQTKRKLYTEVDVDFGNNNEPKKNKLSLNDSRDSKKPLIRKRSGQLKNDEIMKRSKFFQDLPKQRSERMFEKLTEDERKKRVAEQEMEKFESTLETNDEDKIEDPDDVAELVHSEEQFMRRRVVPPLHGKNQGSKPSGRGRGRKPSNRKGSRESSSRENSSQEVDTPKYDPLETTITTTKPESEEEEEGTCPMCNLQFPQSKLPQHASGCEDSYSDRPNTRFQNSYIRSITCEKCDQVLPLDMDYEVHVRECIREHNN